MGFVIWLYLFVQGPNWRKLWTLRTMSWCVQVKWWLIQCGPRLETYNPFISALYFFVLFGRDICFYIFLNCKAINGISEYFNWVNKGFYQLENITMVYSSWYIEEQFFCFLFTFSQFVSFSLIGIYIITYSF